MCTEYLPSLSYIFEEFTREESSTVSGIQGTGLGLSITKMCIRDRSRADRKQKKTDKNEIDFLGREGLSLFLLQAETVTNRIQ